MAVIETGLGGRLDATNVLNPCLTITTHISRDHTEILGSTIRKIAMEKAGIIKPCVPHLIGDLPGAAARVMDEKCRKQKTILYRVRASESSHDQDNIWLEYKGKSVNLTGSSLPLRGEHQLRNCAVALKAVEILSDRGFVIKKTGVRKGLEGIGWAGRFQVIRKKGKPTLVLDVCHNDSGAAAFAETFAQEFPGRKTEIILGLVKGKEHRRIVRSLSSIARGFSLVPMKTKRSMDIGELISAMDWNGLPVKKFGRLGTAYSHLLKSAVSGDIISIVGSHYLVGEFLRNC